MCRRNHIGNGNDSVTCCGSQNTVALSSPQDRVTHVACSIGFGTRAHSASGTSTACSWNYRPKNGGASSFTNWCSTNGCPWRPTTPGGGDTGGGDTGGGDTGGGTPDPPAPPPVTPPTPGSITATRINNSGSQLTLSIQGFNANNGTILEYQVAQNTVNSNPQNSIGTLGPGTTSWTHNVPWGPNTTYYFWARARNSAGWGSWSGVTSATTGTLPDKPATPTLRTRGNAALEFNLPSPGLGTGTFVRKEVVARLYRNSDWYNYATGEWHIGQNDTRWIWDVNDVMSNIGQHVQIQYRMVTGVGAGPWSDTFSTNYPSGPKTSTNTTFIGASSGTDHCWITGDATVVNLSNSSNQTRQSNLLNIRSI